MAPLTDAQRRADAALDQYLDRWNRLSSAQKTSADGAQLRELICGLVAQRNGDAAAREISDTLARTSSIPFNGKVVRADLDERYPRVDTGPAPAAPPLRAPSSGGVDGTHSKVYTAPPGDGRVWLPGDAGLDGISDADRDELRDRDGAIQTLNQALFNVDPALAWHPDGAHLPATGTNISTLGDTHRQATDLLNRLHGAAAALTAAFDAGAAEPLLAEQRDRMRTALGAITDAVTRSQSLPGTLAGGAIAANDGFHQLRGANLDQRRVMGEQIAQREALAAARPSLHEGRRLTTLAGAFTNLPQVPAPSRIADVGAAGQALKTLAGQITAPPVLERQDVTAPGDGGGQRGDAQRGDGQRGGGPAAPVPGGVPAPAAPAPAAAPKGGGDDLSKLLSQLGAVAPMAQQAASVPQQAAGQLPKQLAALPQQLASTAGQLPSQLLRNLRADSPQNARLAGADRAAADAASTDRAAATGATHTLSRTDPAALGVPGSPARPHQLDATGKPADRDGTGKVSPGAVPLSKQTVKPFDLTVPAGGQNVQVKGVPDPRIGEMMLDMADAHGGAPLSVLDAAKAAGMDIPSLGEPLDPKLAKVGYAVVGDVQSGIYLGDGKVLTSTGLVENLDDVLGKGGFVSKIPLPELPDSPPGGANAAPAPTITVGNNDAPAPPSGPVTQLAATPPPAAPAPPPAAPAPLPEAAPVPVPSAPVPAPAPAPAAAPGAPAAGAGDGTPRKVPYQGHALG